jgi:hypothetical protein
MARKTADIPSIEFHHQNAVLTKPLGQSRVWMEIKGQSNSAQVSVGEETTLLVKALLPGEGNTQGCFLCVSNVITLNEEWSLLGCYAVWLL